MDFNIFLPKSGRPVHSATEDRVIQGNGVKAAVRTWLLLQPLMQGTTTHLRAGAAVAAAAATLLSSNPCSLLSHAMMAM